jgi:chaperonin GroEL
MKKLVLNKDEARQKLLNGVNLIADAVASTLGPRGKNVILDQEYGAPIITKDGVSVAKKVESEDRVVNLGVRLLREASLQTNTVVGDGTTTATVLARAIFVEGLKSVVAGANPMDLKRGIDKALIHVLDNFSTQAKAIKEPSQIKQIATISANGDEAIGSLITEAVSKVGEHGVITVEEAKSTKTELKVVEGMQFDRGYTSPYFMTNSEKMMAELESPFVLIVNKKVSVLKELLPVLEIASKAGRSLLIIAEDVEGEALAALIVNKIRGVLKVVTVKAPGFGDRRNEMLEDIAVLTGATVIDEKRGHKLENVSMEYLGSAEKVNVNKNDTTIVNGNGAKKDIQARIQQIKAAITNTSSDYDREKLQERLAKLSDGVAILFVGAETEVAMKELKDRVEDALNATRAAIEKGIVPGGGVACVRAADNLKSFISTIKNIDQARGAKILQKALQAPLQTIVNNAGLDEGSVVLQRVREGKDDFGYNALAGEYGELYKMGVVDPLKVVECATKNAVSIAGILLTTDCIVCEKEKEPATGMSNPMGGMM